MNFYTVKPEILKEIRSLLRDRQPRKINAIKILRRETGCGLKEAKEAIERIQHEEFGKNYPESAEHGAKLICGPRIKRVIVDMGEGDIEVDLETMQMKALQTLPIIGLDACGEILDFVETLKAFSDGKKIGVIE